MLTNAYWGLLLFIIGLAKKILIADPCGEIVTAVHGASIQLSLLSVWFAAFCYSFQIYFDFSGYTDMAIGMARMIGFKFPPNFNRPYSATSITEFWQRWHMTLSRWFRDYLYIPLGGNRGTKIKTYRNLILVFLLCGLWHGAAYSFVLWGLGHGLLLVLERASIVRPNRGKLGQVYTFLAVTLLWVPFCSNSLQGSVSLLKVMFFTKSTNHLWVQSNWGLINPKIITILGISCLICFPHDKLANYLKLKTIKHQYLFGIYCLLLLIWSCLSVVDRGFNPFIYFAF